MKPADLVRQSIGISREALGIHIAVGYVIDALNEGLDGFRMVIESQKLVYEEVEKGPKLQPRILDDTNLKLANFEKNEARLSQEVKDLVAKVQLLEADKVRL